ncbi:MAG: glycoside hydrolase family 3 C-terminal domain-containing protein [Bacteroidales bacterium]|nr:glycoside hydrolase family 3 C-terminal domain-containing protein [Bacteroidales bacterium]
MKLRGIITQRFLLLAALTLLITCKQAEPYLDPNLPISQRVDDLLSRLTLEEKISQLTEESAAIPRLNIPEYNWWSEGLHGVARAGTATVFPQAIGMAATFDDALLFDAADVISDEFRAKYNQFQAKGERDRYKGLSVWSPNINIFRDPRWGRGQETYGEDPYLTSRMGVAFVKGLQGSHPKYLKTLATPKHYVVHSGPEPSRHEFNAEVSQRDFMDTYLPAFEACIVEGKAQSIMGAYNRFRGESCCGSSYLLTDILRKKWGFTGYVVSDCGAIFDIYGNHHLASSEAEAAAIGIKSGCDLSCGNAYSKLGEAIDSGYCTEEDLDVALKRLFTARMKLGMFDPKEEVPFNKIPYEVNDCQVHKELALKAAQESMVLLKNADHTLPLSKNLKSIAVIGPNADNAEVMYGNYNGFPSNPVTPLQGIKNALGEGAEVLYSKGCSYHEDFIEKEVIPSTYLSIDGKEGLKVEYFNNTDLEGEPVLVRTEPEVNFSIFDEAPLDELSRDDYSIRWSGKLTIKEAGTYDLYLSGDDGFRFWLDGELLLDEWESGWKTKKLKFDFKEAGSHDLKIEYYQHQWGASMFLEWGVSTGDMEAEALDIARKSDVVVFVGGLSPRLEGEEMEVDLSGFNGGDRTDITLPKSQLNMLKKLHDLKKPVILVLMNGSALAVNWADENLPAILEAWYPGQSGGTAIADVLFGDYNPGGRLPITFYKSVDQLPPFEEYAMKGRTYRYFEGEPLYEFGYGLSYTQFTYSNLQIPDNLEAGKELKLEVEVENSGDRDGDEVVQVYIRHKDATVPVPLHALKGFKRIHLAAGAKTKVSFTIPVKELTVISDKDEWVIRPGALEVFVGGQQPGNGERNVISKTVNKTGDEVVVNSLD